MKGVSPAPGSGIFCLLSRDPSPTAFTMRSAASWWFRDGSNPRRCAPVMAVFCARSDVAHTDPSSVVVDCCDICHTFLSIEQTDLIESGWDRRQPVAQHRQEKALAMRTRKVWT